MEFEKRIKKAPQFKDLIVFEDDRLIVVNKPPFLASVDERSGEEMSILRMAKKYFADAQVCHRLDKETSGILLIAKTPESYRAVSMAFERRKVNKVYHAIIEGTHVFEDLEVNLPILNQGNKNVSIDRNDGKKALTFFNSLTYFKHFTLVECRPVTGRMHQIRIHLATQRASIVGDAMYGGKPVYLSQLKKGYNGNKNQQEVPIMQRFALHALRLELRIEDQQYQFEAPYTKDFAVLLKQLERFDS